MHHPASQTPSDKCTPRGPHRSSELSPHPALPARLRPGERRPGGRSAALCDRDTALSSACAALRRSDRPSSLGVPTRSGPTSDNGIVIRELRPWVSLSISSFQRSRRRRETVSRPRRAARRAGRLGRGGHSTEPGPVGPAKRRKSPPRFVTRTKGEALASDELETRLCFPAHGLCDPWLIMRRLCSSVPSSVKGKEDSTEVAVKTRCGNRGQHGPPVSSSAQRFMASVCRAVSLGWGPRSPQNRRDPLGNEEQDVRKSQEVIHEGRGLG